MSANDENIELAKSFLNALYAQDKVRVESLLGSTYTQHNQHYADGKRRF